jgi:hypothetical protein
LGTWFSKEDGFHLESLKKERNFLFMILAHTWDFFLMENGVPGEFWIG